MLGEGNRLNLFPSLFLLGHMPCFSNEFLNREMSAEKQKNHLLCRWWEKLKLQTKKLQYYKNMGSSATF